MWIGYYDCMKMWQTELAKHIDTLFNAKDEYYEQVERIMWELTIACQVWRDRFGHYPTVGEIAIFV